MLMSRALFISDAHLGAEVPGALSDRAERLEAFLREQLGRTDHLFIVGDLFEFWFEYQWVIPKESFGILCALHELTRSGVEVHYLAGNHDFNLGHFFEEQLGIHCHSEPLRITLQGKKLLLAHGDGMASDDKSYRLLKRILTHRCSNRLWSWLHPDLGMRLARWVGKTSRKRTADPEVAIAEYSAAVQKILHREKLDAVILGHTHLTLIKELEGGLFVNTGEWMIDPTWIVLENRDFRIERLSGEE